MTSFNRAPLSGLQRIQADQILVSPPGRTKAPRDIFTQFLRKPESVATYEDGQWSESTDDFVPGMASLLAWGGRGKKRQLLMMQESIFFSRRGRVLSGVDGARGPKGRTFVVQPDPIVLRGRRGVQGVAGEPGRRGRAGFNLTEPYLVIPRKGTRGPRGRVLLQQEDTLIFERRIASVTQQHFNVKRAALVFTETQLPFRGKQGKPGVGWPGPRGKPALSP